MTVIRPNLLSPNFCSGLYFQYHKYTQNLGPKCECIQASVVLFARDRVRVSPKIMRPQSSPSCAPNRPDTATEGRRKGVKKKDLKRKDLKTPRTGNGRRGVLSEVQGPRAVPRWPSSGATVRASHWMGF